MKIEISIKGKEKFKAKTQKEVNAFIQDSDVLVKVANFMIKTIRKRKNPSTGRNFKALKDSTIEWRERVARYNPTHQAYSPARSNLTLTGPFIDSITAKIIKSRGVIQIKPTGQHPGYIGKNGKNTRRKPSSNINIALGQAEMGRNILKVTKKMESQIVDIVKKEFKKRRKK